MVSKKRVASRQGQRVFRHLLLLSIFLATSSCSQKGLSLFFDVPPPTAEEIAAEAKARADAKLLLEAAERAARAAKKETAGNNATVAELPPPVQEKPPEIEKAATWKQAEKFFPMDRKGRKGRPNWTEAVRRGIIKPRESIDGTPRPDRPVFLYDFFLPVNDPESDPGYEAYFPHSTHTEWIACESCHPKIFPVRGEKMTKKEIKKGKYCGVCHTSRGGTAFWLRACDRCHLLAKD